MKTEQQFNILDFIFYKIQQKGINYGSSYRLVRLIAIKGYGTNMCRMSTSEIENVLDLSKYQRIEAKKRLKENNIIEIDSSTKTNKKGGYCPYVRRIKPITLEEVMRYSKHLYQLSLPFQLKLKYYHESNNRFYYCEGISKKHFSDDMPVYVRPDTYKTEENILDQSKDISKFNRKRKALLDFVDHFNKYSDTKSHHVKLQKSRVPKRNEKVNKLYEVFELYFDESFDRLEDFFDECGRLGQNRIRQWFGWDSVNLQIMRCKAIVQNYFSNNFEIKNPNLVQDDDEWDAEAWDADLEGISQQNIGDQL